MLCKVFHWYLSMQNIACRPGFCILSHADKPAFPDKISNYFSDFFAICTTEIYSMIKDTCLVDLQQQNNFNLKIFHTEISPFPYAQDGTCKCHAIHRQCTLGALCENHVLNWFAEAWSVPWDLWNGTIHVDHQYIWLIWLLFHVFVIMF